MVALTQIIRHDVSPEEKKFLIGKLKKEGFKVSGGSIYVKKPKKGHPSISSPLSKYFLPVGSIEDQIVYLINLDKTFPKNYHNKLRRICSSL